MPMPPPKASTEHRDPHTDHEVGQILRALHATGPQSAESLSDEVGGRYWEPGRFARAVSLAVADGLVTRDGDGVLTPV